MFSCMKTLPLSEVRQLLNARKGCWLSICEQTKLDYSWLSKVAQGRIANPGYEKVSRLVGYLMGSDKAA